MRYTCHARRPQITHTLYLVQPCSATSSAYVSTSFLLHLKVTLACARDHIGIRFSSVNRPNRSSADAWNVASTSTTDVLIFREDAAGLFASPWTPLLVDAGAGAGELVRLGAFEPTIMSLPCVSIKSTGNTANFVSRAVGSFSFASAKSAVVSGEDSDVRDHWYFFRTFQ